MNSRMLISIPALILAGVNKKVEGKLILLPFICCYFRDNISNPFSHLSFIFTLHVLRIK